MNKKNQDQQVLSTARMYYGRMMILIYYVLVGKPASSAREALLCEMPTESRDGCPFQVFNQSLEL